MPKFPDVDPTANKNEAIFEAAKNGHAGVGASGRDVADEAGPTGVA